jgi:predicted enzyme related to lactoylglutathione lyase
MAAMVRTRLNRPVWVDLSSSDPEAARNFYAKLFDWKLEVSEDPQYGGYATAKLGSGGDVAGIGPTQSPDEPTVWMLYIGTDDAEALGEKVAAAGGTVAVPSMQVGDMGRMAVFQDPTGAFISAWQSTGMDGFSSEGNGSFGWAELNARGVDAAIDFYQAVFGWTARTSPMGEGQPPYTEFQLDGESVAGCMEMSPMAPAGMPSYWMIYFDVTDVDDAFRRAIDAGATEIVAPGEFPGGRFAIVSDPQGAMFGLLKTE